MSTEKVWFVTGASQGLGLTLVKQLLSTGYRIAATSRDACSLNKAVGLIDKERFLSLAVDLTSTESIQQAVDETMASFGRIDVVVNNAGYGMAGTVEETEEKKIRDIVEINLLATVNVTKAILPAMRQQRSGYFINISSVAGFAGAPGWSVYSATKAAVTAFSEVMALDAKELGIKVTVVEPSGFRTGFLSKDSLAFTESRISDYQLVRKTQERYLATGGQQAGDPERSAAIFIELAEHPEPPLHLFLGADAYTRANDKIRALAAELEQWKTLTLSADFPQ
jgi:NAD(P)-dependent dehydrogenase (short-subunit alcohol dehydrogenase family)